MSKTKPFHYIAGTVFMAVFLYACYINMVAASDKTKIAECSKSQAMANNGICVTRIVHD